MGRLRAECPQHRVEFKPLGVFELGKGLEHFGRSFGESAARGVGIGECSGDLLHLTRESPCLWHGSPGSLHSGGEVGLGALPLGQ